MLSNNNIKKSNTSKIFEKNNFGKYLSILSNENIIERLIKTKAGNVPDNRKKSNDFLAKKRILLGDGDENASKVTVEKLSELLQSAVVYAKFTNEIISEIEDVQGLSSSFKISYISHDDYKKVKGNEGIPIPDFLNNISIKKMLSESDTTNDNINNTDSLQKLNTDSDFPYLRNRNQPGLSAIQLFNPELRICFKNSQELDLFFNILSGLDITMSMPYVNAEFIIPKNAVRNINNDNKNYNLSYLTTSLNNFLLGDSNFQRNNDTNLSQYDIMPNNAKAINGDFYIDDYSFVRNIKNQDGQYSQIKKTYNRQSLNNAVFFAPQTMINADYNIADNPNAIIDKFRPFMSITSLTFDVRATKGLLNYKTATLELVLYDKARMSQIAPFIKPELLNAVSSEVILEYGWQHNLGDSAMNTAKSVTLQSGETINYFENPIAEFLNSLKVKEKYIIVNSSYTINDSGYVNITLNLALKGAAELRGIAFQHETIFSKLQTDLNSLINILKEKIDQINSQNNVDSLFETKSEGHQSNATSANTTNFIDTKNVINNLSIKNVSLDDLNKIKSSFEIIKQQIPENTTDTAAIKQKYESFEKSIDEAIAAYNIYSMQAALDFNRYFPFFNIHNSDTTSEDCNDPFVDEYWWNENLKDSNANSDSKIKWNTKKWISLGKLLISIIGKRLAIEENRYNEIQFIFYNLNDKAIRASFLNIASIPVEKDFIEEKLKFFIQNASKISNEGMIDFILKLCVNQKAAAVYGLNNYLTFNENNLTVYKNESSSNNEIDQKRARNEQTKSINAEIFKQYYGHEMPVLNNENEKELFGDNPDLSKINDIYDGLFDLTFKQPNICINFDSTFHENDQNVSILKLHFYDKNDNPFESLSEIMESFHNNQYQNIISPITALRSSITNAKTLQAKLDKKREEEKDNEKKKKIIEESKNRIKSSIERDIIGVIDNLIQNKLVVLKDETDQILEDVKTIQLDKINKIVINSNNKNKLENFSNLKTYFKTYMPSLTLGQSHSALVSGNITTNQDPKYTTSQILKANGDVETNQNDLLPFDFEIFNQTNNSPTWVLPAQASIDIIGCPIVNFSQLIFIDFNTGTSIDNMYFISGLKHSISPGKFTTSLTLTQRDIYSKFTAESSSIQSFFKAANNFKKLSLSNKPEIKTKQSTSSRYQISFLVDYNRT